MRNRGVEVTARDKGDIEQGAESIKPSSRSSLLIRTTKRGRIKGVRFGTCVVSLIIVVCFFLLIFKRQQSFAALTATPPLQIVSTPSQTRITASVRGNLGPPSVMLQNSTSDWLKDRWQAASDMHGTAIRGPHWVLIEFEQRVSIQRIVLDWESAYSDDYQLVGTPSGNGSQNETTISIYDTATSRTAALSDNQLQQQLPTVTTRQWGQSPGVEFKCPLHIQHTIDLAVPTALVSSLRLVIRRPAQHGWGVSLWRFQVYRYLGQEHG